MKKLIILIASLFMITGCSQKSADNSENKENTETATSASITQEVVDSISVTEVSASVSATESEIENMPAWQRAYRNKLYDIINSDNYIADKAFFSIYDINNDDIPELFISKDDCHAAACNVYTFTDYLIDLGGYGSWGNCQFYPNKNILHGGYTGQGEYHNHYYRLNNDGSMSELIYFYDNSGGIQETVYKINDVEVTEEEYEAVTDEYSDPYNSIRRLGRDLKLSKEVVDGVFNGASDWKECYKKFLYGLLPEVDDYACFSIYDVTDDGIPELFIAEGTRHTSECYIYTFKNGLVYIDKLGTYGDLGYSPEKKLFTSSNLSQGYYSCGYYELDEDFILQTEIGFFTNYNAVATEEERIYEINHEAVSYDEFKNAYEQYTSINDFIGLGRDYHFTEEEIQKALAE